MIRDISVVLHTFDGYEFLWEGFLHFWHKYWIDTDIVSYFCNEEKTCNFDGFINLKTGKGEWSDRLITILNFVKTKYVFYVQEDMWVHRSLPAGAINSLLWHMEEKDMLSVKIFSLNRLCTYEKYDENIIKQYDENSLYLMNHQAAIWDREFFLSCLEKNENPWNNEKQGTKRLQLRPEGKKIYQYPFNWYAGVCRKGELNKHGLKLLSEIKK